MSVVNNLSHNEEHLNVSSLSKCFYWKQLLQNKMHPGALGRQHHVQ